MIIFNRYWISDGSGTGIEKWSYFVGNFANDDREALENYEPWARDANFSYKIELNVEPSREFVEAELTKVQNLRDHYADYAKRMSELHLHKNMGGNVKL